MCPVDLELSENGATPKSSISMLFLIINHPFWGSTLIGTSKKDISLVMFFGAFLANFLFFRGSYLKKTLAILK
jgi:hypothetical protein